MTLQDAFGVVATLYAVANLASMGLHPKLRLMIVLAVPVPLIAWLLLCRFFASRATPLPAGGAHPPQTESPTA